MMLKTRAGKVASIARRSVLLLAALLLFQVAMNWKVPIPVARASASSTSPTLTSATLSPVTPYAASGDVWTTTWADDGNLYSIADDATGFGCSSGSNFMLNEEVGSDPNNLTGSAVNCFNSGSNNYGGIADTQGNPDGRVWKAMGLISIGGVLYMGISRHLYGGVQPTQNATIIKSTDHGVTWSGSESNSYNNPMFPGTRFSTPFFIEYGQDDNTASTADGGDTYVYAISNDGSWNDGNSIILGRVLRTLIGNLNGADWQYYAGNGNWTSNMNSAVPIISAPGQLSMTSVTYDQPLGIYIMPEWYYPNSSQTTTTVLDYYQSPTPWGPWTRFTNVSTSPAGWYDGCLVSKFIASNGLTGSLFTAGNYQDATYYKLNTIPISFAQGPIHEVNDTDPSIQYSGSAWVYSPGRPYNDYSGDAHYTTNISDSLTYTFTGTGIQYISELHPLYGDVGVSIDGGPSTTVSAYTPGNRQNQVTLYNNQSLSNQQHTITLTMLSGSYMLLDAFMVTTTEVNDTDPNIQYTGSSWVYSPGRLYNDYSGDAHYTTNIGDSLTYTFTGTGVQYISELHPLYGDVGVSIDGGPSTTVSAYNSAGRLSQVTVFSILGLASGQHTITLTMLSGSYMLLDAFMVQP